MTTHNACRYANSFDDWYSLPSTFATIFPFQIYEINILTFESDFGVFKLADKKTVSAWN